MKRQNAGGGVGNIISNVLKKRNGISRRAPRLLCTLEPGEATLLHALNIIYIVYVIECVILAHGSGNGAVAKIFFNSFMGQNRKIKV